MFIKAIHGPVIYLMLLAIIFLSGCGGSSGKSNNQVAKQTNTSIVGRWTDGCNPIGIAGTSTNSAMSSTTIEFGAEGSVNVYSSEFKGATCSAANIQKKLRVYGNYHVTASMVTVSSRSVIRYVTYYDQNTINQANEKHECEDTNWEVGVEHEGCGPEFKFNSSYAVKDQKLTLGDTVLSFMGK